MPEALRLLAVLAHPDDESLGLGGTLARCAAEGIETHLLTATLGQRGRFFHNQDRPANEEVGRVREGELRAAAAVLGVRDVALLGYMDGELDRVQPAEAIGRIARHLRRVRPHVVISFAYDGAYGHPDHIAISQFTSAAVVLAAAAGDDAFPPHLLAKLYHMAWTPRVWELYQRVFKRMVSVVDGVERQANAWPEWALTRFDARAYWDVAWRAVQCHRTQLAAYAGLDRLTPHEHRIMWGEQHYCRIFSMVNGGRERETDLFAGLR